METFYKERANGKWEYWTYSDGQRIYVSASSIAPRSHVVTVK